MAEKKAFDDGDSRRLQIGTTADMARAAREAVVLCAAAVGERMRGER